MPAEYVKEPKNLSRKEWEREQCFRKMILADAEFCQSQAGSFDHFIFLMKRIGYQFEYGKASNVSVMLDTFHMNIEEESIGAAIREAGSLLGHFHTGECNRMVPGRGRTPWREIGEALRDINYDKTVVMEPFVMPGGTVGQNIKVWRDIVPDTSEEALDRDAKKALEFERYMLG